MNNNTNQQINYNANYSSCVSLDLDQIEADDDDDHDMPYHNYSRNSPHPPLSPVLLRSTTLASPGGSRSNLISPGSSRTRFANGNSGGISFAESVTVIDYDDSIRELPLQTDPAEKRSLAKVSEEYNGNDSMPSNSSNSASNHSLTLDDLKREDNLKREEPGNPPSKESSVEALMENPIARTLLEKGIGYTVGPVWVMFKGFVGRVLGRNNTDPEVPLQQPPAPPGSETAAGNAQSAAAAQPSQSVTTAAANTVQSQEQVLAQETARKVAEESTRQMAGGYFIPGQPLSQQVMQQAMVQAAMTAGSSASQGAAALAATSTAAAGAAVGTKLLIIGLILFCITGVGIAAGIFMQNRFLTPEEELKNGGGGDWNSTNFTGIGNGLYDLNNTGMFDNNQTEPPGGHGGNGGPSSGGGGGGNPAPPSSANCPRGQVLTNLGSGYLSLPCLSAIGICKEWQEAYDGICHDCTAGQVSVMQNNITTHVNCVPCVPGQVRQNAAGDGKGSCLRATGICNAWERAAGGMCSKCFAGQVSMVDADGQFTHKDCAFCPDGQVRSSVDGEGEGPCVPAKQYCDTWQVGKYGKCNTCPPGEISLFDNTTSQYTYDNCTYCADGLVRSSADGSAPGLCVSSLDYCQLWQNATTGKCVNCDIGAISVMDDVLGVYTHLGCEYCPDGQVRVDKAGAGLGDCVSAVGICDVFQAATRGRCVDCAQGQAASVDSTGQADYLSCDYCPIGTVRSSADGMTLGPCVPADRWCKHWQWAAFGKCNDCDRGQVSLTDPVTGNWTYMGCIFCRDGLVRNDDEGKGAGDCVSAVSICRNDQRAYKGQCVNCLDGQLSSNVNGTYDHMTCV